MFGFAQEKLTKIEIESLRRDVVPQPSALLAQVLQLLQTLVDETDLVLSKVFLGDLFELSVEVDQEVVNTLLQVIAILLTLDQDAEALNSAQRHHAAAYNIAKLLLSAQSVEAWLVHHL